MESSNIACAFSGGSGKLDQYNPLNGNIDLMAWLIRENKVIQRL